MNLDHNTLKELSKSIRALSIDAIEEANSGHPGLPLGMADVMTVLFSKFIKINPSDPHWPDRDRFILSAGHGSMLLYAIMYLTGFKDITIDDIKSFRTLHAKCAGHPEHGIFAGIETTTGPLGQGLANAVGMALAEKKLSQEYTSNLIDHYTYVVVGDGCLMEGISQEAISFAGHYKLNKLITFFDNNNISIDGDVSITHSDDMKKRFEASNWNIIKINGHDYNEIEDSIRAAQKSSQPSLIICDTIIGYGSPNKAGTSKAHGSALGREEALLTKQNLGIDYDKFQIPENIISIWQEAVKQNNSAIYDSWYAKLNNLPLAQLNKFNHQIADNIEILPWREELVKLKQQVIAEKPNLATRQASKNVLAILTKAIPYLIGGSADLSESNQTQPDNMKEITAHDFSGTYIHYGVREHAMAGIMNGIVLHKGYIAYAGTFLVFSDYCRPSIRLSALMKQRVIYIMTHDSIGLGEDGPTHQPVEQLTALRAIPDLFVFRPCDMFEVIECWECILNLENAPSIFSLTRQKLPTITQVNRKENLCKKGGYIISNNSTESDIILIATGSEVEIALEVEMALSKLDINARVVSMPCMELFQQQSKAYQTSIIGGFNDKRVIIEAGLQMSWDKYLNHKSLFFGVNQFGISAPAKDLYEHFGLTASHIVNKILDNLKNI